MYYKGERDKFIFVFSRNIMNLVHISRLTWLALTFFIQNFTSQFYVPWKIDTIKCTIACYLTNVKNLNGRKN